MRKITVFLSSYSSTIILLLVYAIFLAAATFIEKYHGTEAAKFLVYYSPLLIFLQFLMAVNFALILIEKGYFKRKKWAMVTIHTAFIVILAGAMITHLFGKEGTVHIREGAASNEMIIRTADGVVSERLPFSLELTDFRLTRYPGSASPSSYESDLRVHADGEVRQAKVFMNNVLDVKGYRFFQASYDEDEKGTVLSVNKDAAGRFVTYSGYFLLTLGFVLMFFVRNSRFRNLGRQLNEIREKAKSASFFLLFMLFPISVFSQNEMSVPLHAVNPAHAAKFGALPIQSGGRVMPMNTFSSEILRKLHKKTTIHNLNSDQFLLSFLAMPQAWMRTPFLVSPNEETSRICGLSHPYFAYSQAFDEKGGYALYSRVEAAYHKPPAERTRLDKDVMKLDEQINLVYRLLNYEALYLFPNPADPLHTWYAPGDNLTAFPKEDALFITRSFASYLAEVNSAWRSGDWTKPDQILRVLEEYQQKNDHGLHINPQKIQAEIRYNKMNIFGWCKFGYFILGGLLLVFAFMRLLKKRKWAEIIVSLLSIGILLVFFYHIYGMGMRWYISGYAPWSNSYETMVYVAWATVLAGLIFGRKSTITMALATLFGGIILFVSGLNWMDPQIGTLVPVLKSPWLMFHVAVIVAAYGFFGIGFLLGITNLSLIAFSKNNPLTAYRVRELSIINNMALLVGLALMSIGTFLGAIWANESWGRYWGWDPKETWALITMVVYTIVTHLHLLKARNSDWLFNLLSVFAFSAVLMTFLGVNYFLSGMHSYGQTDGVSTVFLYITAAFIAVGVLGVVSYKRQKEQRTKNKEQRQIVLPIVQNSKLKTNNMINWGFIGCGSVTEKKSGPAFGKVEGSKVVAVMRRDAAKAEDYARRHGVGKWYTDAYELINDPDVTAVYVATPPGLHAEYAIACMRAGKPVYVEKPLASSYEECLAVKKVSEETGVPCFVAYYRRTLPYFLRVKQLIDDGAQGAVSTVQIRFALPPRDEDLQRETLPWRVKKNLAGAGYFYDLASHQLDLLDYLLGEITEAEGFTANIGGLYDVEDTVSGAFRFRSGALGSGSWSFVAPKDTRTDTIDFVGTKGKLTCSTFGFTPIVLETSEGRQEFMEENPENIQFYLIQSIVNYLNGKGDYPVSDFRSATRANWVMDKILGEIL